jgi:GNAT superfamily N-acetyltransferase
MGNNAISIDDIKIRTTLEPGDIGYIIYRHGKLYSKEYGYGISFEAYVAAGFFEFYKSYDPGKDRVWICEHDESIVGFVLLMHRENNSAQLRYFYLEPGYRNIGLGKKLMSLYMNFFKECGYTSSYLWTTNELPAAASLYTRYGFSLAEEKESMAFGKPLKEQKYVLVK